MKAITSARHRKFLNAQKTIKNPPPPSSYYEGFKGNVRTALAAPEANSLAKVP